MIFHLTDVQNAVGYVFKSPELLLKAFTHASYSDEKKGEKNNERLEFLGDSVLGLVVAEHLFTSTNMTEGEMTVEKQGIVSAKPLSLACKKLGIDSYLLVGENVTITDNLRENLIESLIGALYLDGGIEEAKKFIFKNLIGKRTSKKGLRIDDYKSKLNELASKNKFTVKYELLSKDGADNDPSYTVAVIIEGKQVCKATATGKKQNAEQLVARKALQRISKNIKRW